MSDALWVAVIGGVSSTIAASVAAAGALLSAHRTRGQSKQSKDIVTIKNLLMTHVTDARLHPELADLGPRQERRKRNGR
jgi:hypothetical protein